MQSEHAGTGTVRSVYGFASGCVALSFLLQEKICIVASTRSEYALEDM